MTSFVTLNRPALWRPLRTDETSIRTYAGQYPYLTREGVLEHSSATNPVTRYAKNFKKYRLKFSLFIYSDEKDVTAIENFLNSIVKQLDKTQISEALTTASITSFSYLDDYYEGGNS